MAADFSRVRHNPLLDYAAVELKQGGVLLDADANELTSILDRRLRALAGDVLGRATVGANTPDAFRVTVGGGGLLIGRGRLYVDGLLAENHGATDPAQREFDNVMAETRFAADTPYSAQPYLPDSPPLPETGRHLVYLDAWDREVTHVKQPDLVEIAIGVETSSRRQTVWQVRVLAEDAGADISCESPDAAIPGWSEIIAPSTGRLTTGTYDVSAVTDPCELPPTGGYRGLENQLFRVEIHDPGQPGGNATFKWSRNNASFAVLVDSIVSSTVLQLDSLGRDDVLRFKSGDWVEITDDVREFSQAAGEIRKITVDEANLRISFTPPLPAEMLPASFPDSAFPGVRHTRVGLWDQGGKTLAASGNGNTTVFADLDAVGSTGVIPVPAAGTTLLLENGVTVSFASVGAEGFRTGDYWVFAARTADASVELLDQAPPRGIHHHYARLGVWDVTARSVTDCRTPWPPAGGGDDCSCGECVTPESHASGALTIQAAVDRIRDVGGTVCLAAGQYVLREPVRIASASAVRIVGQGIRTQIAAEGTAFDLDGVNATTLERFAVGSRGQRAVVRAQVVRQLRLDGLTIVTARTRDGLGTAVELGGVVMFSGIRGCRFESPVGIGTPAPDPDGGSAPPLMTAGLDVEGNVFVCDRSAMALREDSMHAGPLRVVANTVIGPKAGAITIRGLPGLGASVSIIDNDIHAAGAGIEATGNGVLIDGNFLRCTLEGAGGTDDFIDGIRVTSTALNLFLVSRCQIVSNHIFGFRHAGVRCAAPVHALLVKQNVIQLCGDGVMAISEGNPGSASIENNHITDIQPIQQREASACLGIAAAGWQSIAVNANVVRRVARGDIPMNFRAGVGVLAFAQATVNGNQVSDIGSRGDFLELGVGVFVQPASTSDIDVSQNYIARDLEGILQQSRSRFFGLAIDVFGGRVRTVFATVAIDEDRTVVFGARRPYLVSRPVNAAAAGSGSTASVHGNVIRTRDAAEVVQISVGGLCTFANNHCERNPDGSITGVQLAAGTIIASSNRINAGAPSLRLLVRAGLTVLGNIVRTTITVNDNNLGEPWKPLNVVGV
jgi:hypothetical protein